MEKLTTIQTLRKEEPSPYEMAERYYGILSVINGFGLTERELQLMAFTAVWGNISLANAREEFCRKYKTTAPTINNMISRLKKTGIIVKEAGKIKVHPSLCLNFKQPLTLVLKFTQPITET